MLPAVQERMASLPVLPQRPVESASTARPFGALTASISLPALAPAQRQRVPMTMKCPSPHSVTNPLAPLDGYRQRTTDNLPPGTKVSDLAVSPADDVSASVGQSARGKPGFRRLPNRVDPDDDRDTTRLSASRSLGSLRQVRFGARGTVEESADARRLKVSQSLDNLRSRRAGQESAYGRGGMSPDGRPPRRASLQDLLEAQEQRATRDFLPQINTGPRSREITRPHSRVEVGSVDFPDAEVNENKSTAPGPPSPFKPMLTGAQTESISPNHSTRLLESFAKQWPKHQAKELQQLYEAYRTERKMRRERSSPGKGVHAEGSAELNGSPSAYSLVSFEFLLRTYFPNNSRAEIAAMSAAVQAIDAAEKADHMRSTRRREISKLFNAYTQGREVLGIGISPRCADSFMPSECTRNTRVLEVRGMRGVLCKCVRKGSKQMGSCAWLGEWVSGWVHLSSVTNGELHRAPLLRPTMSHLC